MAEHEPNHLSIEQQIQATMRGSKNLKDLGNTLAERAEALSEEEEIDEETAEMFQELSTIIEAASQNFNKNVKAMLMNMSQYQENHMNLN